MTDYIHEEDEKHDKDEKDEESKFQPVQWGQRPEREQSDFSCDCAAWWRAATEKLETWFPWASCSRTQDADASSAEEPPRKRWLYVGKSWEKDGFVHQPHLENEEETIFCSNYISTTKYTVTTFLPLNLFEQFQKKANLYFLIIACLSFSSLSPKNPVFSVAPLTFVLAVSAIKEAFEDYKRYEMDKEINNRKVLTYRPKGPENRQWEFQPVAWQDIEVGDIVKVTKKDRAFPADLLLLQSSTNQGLCNIETSNLDGETNLKIKQAVGATYLISSGDETGDGYPTNPELDFKMVSEAPNEKMDKSSWNGTLYFAGKTDGIPVGMNQLLLRGCTLRNTDWVISMVVFTGNESKLMLNNKSRGFKRSNIDLTVDKALYIIFGAQAFLCLFGVIAHYVWLKQNASDQWYQYVKKDGDNVSHYTNIALLNYFTFLVLLDLFVPISLYVSMELVKFSQAWLINQDKQMICITDDEETINAQARTSNLNEELGQVSFIFTDKTGTLTQNKMEFIRCHVNGVRYGPGEMEKQNDHVDRVETPSGLPPFDEATCRFTDNRLARRYKDPVVNDFLTCMATCHSIIPEYPEEEDGAKNDTKTSDDDTATEYSRIIYQAASPDEKALVVFARNMHFVFHDSHVQILTVEKPGDKKKDQGKKDPNKKDKETKQVDGQRFYVNIFGEEYEFDIYHFLEFSSARKRMSVVLKDPRDNKYKLYCKGADNVIFQRLRDSEKTTSWPDLLQSLATFAADGLRTLVCGSRILTEEEYWNWLIKLNKAREAMDNRDELVDACYDEIEQDLTLLGATAIEDRLQDKVPDTIANLAIAGISIWVLTGDKVETAINIGRSCRLLTPVMNEKEKTLYVIDPDEKLSDEEAKGITEKAFDEAWEFLKDTRENNPDQGLVISGKALGYVFPHRKRDAKGKEIPPTEEQLVEEHRMQEKVLKICKKCRAVVCCRVSPKQKSQMVQLVKLNVKKTITLAIGDGANDVPMIKAAHVGIGISGQEGLQAVMASDYAIGQFRFLQELLLIHGAWDYRRISVLILYSFYKNICFSMTQIWYAFFSGYTGTLFYDAFSGSCYNLVFTALPVLFAATIDRPYSKELAKYCPELYANGPQNGSFSLRIFGIYVMEGAIHSIILFFGTVFFIDSQTHSDGKVSGFWISATTMFTSLVTVATIKMMVETRTWTTWTGIIFFLSLLLWFVFAIVWSAIPPSLGWGNSDIYQVAQHAFKMPVVWFTIMFAVALCIVPEVIVRYVKRMYFPTRLNVIEELESYPDLRNKFIQEVATHLKRQEAVLSKEGQEAVKSREHMGFAEFQVDKNHPDYIMSQATYMRVVASGRRRGLKHLKLFGRRKKNKDKEKEKQKEKEKEKEQETQQDKI